MLLFQLCYDIGVACSLLKFIVTPNAFGVQDTYAVKYPLQRTGMFLPITKGSKK